MKSYQELLKSRRIFFLALLLLCVVTYGNSLGHDFLIDDHDLIVNNESFRNPKFMVYEFLPWIDPYRGEAQADPYYRPLAHVIPMLCYFVYGNNATGYHIINLLLFYFCCLSLFALIRLLFKDEKLAFLASALFAVHPINSLIVNYVTADVYAVLFIAMVWSMITFVRAKEDRSKRVGFYVLSVFLFFIAVLCHETALVFPLYLVLVLGIRKIKFSKVNTTVMSLYFLIAGIFVALKLQITNVGENFMGNVAHVGIGFGVYAASISKLIFWYLSKFIQLDGVVLIWQTPPVENNVGLWVLALISLVGVWIVSFYWRKTAFVIPAALSWLMIGLSPVLLGAMYELQHGFLIEPHWLYFSSIGFFILLAFALMSLFRIIHRAYALAIILLLFVIMFSSTWKLNKIWADEKKYCLYWAKETPHFTVPLNYLSGVYMGEGNFAMARKYLNQIRAMGLTDAAIYYKLGNLDAAEGNMDLAYANFQEALKLSPKSSYIRYSLAQIAVGRNQLDEAKGYLEASLKFNPMLLESRILLARLAWKEGDFKKAELYYRENLELFPNHQESALELKAILSSAAK